MERLKIMVADEVRMLQLLVLLSLSFIGFKFHKFFYAIIFACELKINKGF